MELYSFGYGIVEVVLGLGDRCEELAIASEVQGEADESIHGEQLIPDPTKTQQLKLY